MRNAIHFLGGSVTVYLLMAACSAGGKGRQSSDEMASAGGTPSNGATQSAGGVDGVTAGNATDPTAGKSSGMGGIIGEMMDPVPEADAETSGTRLKARRYAGEDGSKQFIGWHDEMRNEDCSFMKAGDGSLRCLPIAAGTVVGYYADAGCSVPFYVVSKGVTACGDAKPQYALSYDAEFCAKELLALMPSPATTIYTGTPAACTASPAPAHFAYYTKGNTVAWSAFVAANEVID